MRIYLDIETIPSQDPAVRAEIESAIAPPANYSKPETIAKWEAEQKPQLVEDTWRKTAFHGDRGEIVCIGWANDNAAPRSVVRDLRDSEPVLLMEFFDAISAACAIPGCPRKPVFIGHNVRDFDLRFLFQRAVILGVRPPVDLPHDARPGSDHVFDTMTAWAGWGGRISLDRLCRALGLPQKGEEIGEDMDGSKVWDFVQAGRLDDIATYCRGDVERVRDIYNRLTFAVAGERPPPAMCAERRVPYLVDGIARVASNEENPSEKVSPQPLSKSRVEGTR